MAKRELKLSLQKPVCIEGISEDELRELVNALVVNVADQEYSGEVFASSGVSLKFSFGSTGKFDGAFAKLNSTNVPVIHAGALAVFKGRPSDSYPGPGWEVEIELTKEFLYQPDNQSAWKVFYASRTDVL